jgi:hypothetical protein
LIIIIYFAYEVFILRVKNQFLLKQNSLLSQIYFHKICITKRKENIDKYDLQLQNIDSILKEQLSIKL